MMRRNARLRKEFLYRKSLEGKERVAYERKMQIKKALAEGKAIPTELLKEEAQLRQELAYEDDATMIPKTHIDDEYAQAGTVEPKILITTSHDPSSRLIQFVKELKYIFPNSQRMNRGSYVTKDIVAACRSNEFTDLIMVHEHRGEPDAMIVCHLPYGPTAFFSLTNAVLRHDVQEKKPISQVYPHLIFNNFNSKLGERVKTILKYLFPPAKPDAKRVITFSNENDFISFRHHNFSQQAKEVEIEEVGPRFEMRLYQIRLGTVDMVEAETEWSLRPYMNTAKAKQNL
eukprot:TRINITY_DN9700_c0_g1_i1.p1 TRINITY_DN9700_c0_g1~~TRINITY_DN9700_c0_g1_i1.p1  ORF type:complete len:287 (-),score=63.99 TRINITY_DN9700_c0_g1_i1:116-976(-)